PRDRPRPCRAGLRAWCRPGPAPAPCRRSRRTCPGRTATSRCPSCWPAGTCRAPGSDDRRTAALISPPPPSLSPRFSLASVMDLDRQALDAADEIRAQELVRTGLLDRADALDQFLQQ